jgi:hypothetical protein
VRAPRFPTIVILAEALQVPAGRLFAGIPEDEDSGAARSLRGGRTTIGVEARP